jgi:biopolymer transport protein ExbD
MIKFKTSQKPFYNFQHTALTDVIFLLMIFFLLTSSFVIQEGANLRPAGQGKSALPAKFIEVKFVSGQVFLDDRPVSKKEYFLKLQSQVAVNPGLHLIFKAASPTPLGNFRYYLEKSQEAGLENFTFELLN